MMSPVMAMTRVSAVARRLSGPMLSAVAEGVAVSAGTAASDVVPDAGDGCDGLWAWQLAMITVSTNSSVGVLMGVM